MVGGLSWLLLIHTWLVGRTATVRAIAGVGAGIVIGSVVTLWLGEAVLDAAHRMLDRMSGRRDRVNFELLLQ